MYLKWRNQVKNLLLTFALLSSSALLADNVYRNYSDLMYIPKKFELMYQGGISGQSGNQERVYAQASAFTNLSKKRDQISNLKSEHNITFGISDRLNVGFNFGYVISDKLKNKNIPTVGNSFYSSEVQYNESNQGLIDPEILASFRLLNQKNSAITVDLKGSVVIGMQDGERSEGSYKSPLSQLPASNAVQTGNVAQGGSTIRIGSVVGRKFSSKFEGTMGVTGSYNLKRKISDLRGEYNAGILNSKVTTINSFFDIQFSLMLQYNMDPFHIYGGFYSNFIQSRTQTSRYNILGMQEVENFDPLSSTGLKLGGKWSILNKKLLIDASVFYQQNMRMTSDYQTKQIITNSSTLPPMQFVYNSQGAFGGGVKVLFLF